MKEKVNLILLIALITGSVAYATYQVILVKKAERTIKKVQKIVNAIEIDPFTGKVL